MLVPVNYFFSFRSRQEPFLKSEKPLNISFSRFWVQKKAEISSFRLLICVRKIILNIPSRGGSATAVTFSMREYAGGRPSQSSVSPKALPLHPPPSWARKPVLHLRCVTQLTLVCILRYSGCSSLPIQSSVCYDIQNGSLCRSSFLYATLFQNASLHLFNPYTL